MKRHSFNIDRKVEATYVSMIFLMRLRFKVLYIIMTRLH